MNKTNFKAHLAAIHKPDIVKTQSELIQSQADQKIDSIAPKVMNSTNDPEDVWKIVMEYIRMGNSKETVNQWYSDSYIDKIENGVVDISCSNAMNRDWIQNNHHHILTGKIESTLGYKIELRFIVRSAVVHTEEAQAKYEYYDPYAGREDSEQQNLFSQPSGISTQSNIGLKPNVNEGKQAIKLNPRYTLQTYIVGSGNQLAHAVAEGSVDSPGAAYNPVFFYGPSGVGKTHLMQAIGHAVLLRDPTAKVLYVPIETFMNELIEAIRTRKNEEFRQKYRQVDVLIIDDIQFISTYHKTREELFNTFNALYQANKQIVIASDRPPKEIDNLPDRLRTRFEGGMVVDIQPPDLETRIAILRQKAKASDVSIPDETIMFVAQNIETSVRELEGAMTKIITHTKITQSNLELEEVAKMLQVDLDTKRRRIKPDKIIAAVSEVFDVTPKEIRGKRRTAYIAMARQSTMYLLREELELPLDKVAKLVSRKDHTTVIHACSKIELLIAKDKGMKDKIELCKSMLRS